MRQIGSESVTNDPFKFQCARCLGQVDQETETELYSRGMEHKHVTGTLSGNGLNTQVVG